MSMQESTPVKPPVPNPPKGKAISTTNIFEVALFFVMVTAIASVGFLVMGEFGLLTAVALGLLIGTVAAVVLSILLGGGGKKRRSKRVGQAPRADPGREGPAVPSGRAEQDANTTAQSRTLAGAGDAGGVGVPADALARSPGDPAERPVAGAGGPTHAPSSEAAASVDPDPARPSTSAGPSDPIVTEPRIGEESPGDEARPAAVPTQRPTPLDAPREGRPDDLTQIRGIGPALEAMLHRMGVYHFDQIAAWGPAEVAWADDNLEGFKGRVTRDDWVDQARDLSGPR